MAAVAAPITSDMSSRADKVAKNMRTAIVCQILMVLVNFVLRRVFVVTLGKEYLGLNGLFADILAMLSLAELGFGVSIIYSLYRPVAEGDTVKVRSLMRLYRNIYRVVGAFVFVAGLAITPWLDFFVREMPDIPESIRLIYILNVVNASISYFFIYKASLLFADQKKYVELVITTGVKFAAAVAEISILLIWRDYIAYLAAVIAGTILQNLLISRRVDRLYPYLRESDVQSLPDEDRNLIRKNVGAMVFHKLGSVVIFSTDSILMAKFVSVAAVGLYSNYMLIRKALSSVIEPAFTGITSGLGNLNVSEDDDHKYRSFCNVLFFAAWAFGLCSICLLNLFNPFISLWLGDEYTFGPVLVLLIVISFYLYAMRMPVGSARDAMGLFLKDKYKPIPECILNLGLSILWARQLGEFYGPEGGIAGVVLGTIASTILVPFWVEPFVVYKYGFNRSVWPYMGRYALYTGITAAACAACMWLCSLLPGGIGGLVLRALVCLTVPNAIFLLCYHRTEEFGYLRSHLMSRLRR